MAKKLILAVGNSMMGDDAAGPLLAQKLKQAPAPDWDVINGGSAPENQLYRIRERQPDQVLIVDAAEMGLPPGEIRLLSEEIIADQFILTTHSLPLTFLIQSLKEFVPEVTFVGIQPDLVGFGYPMSPSVREAVEIVYTHLQGGAGREVYQEL